MKLVIGGDDAAAVGQDRGVVHYARPCRAVRRGPDHDVNVMAARQRDHGAEGFVRTVEPGSPARVPFVGPVPGQEHLSQQDELGAVFSFL